MNIKDLYIILMKNNLGNVKRCRTIIKHSEILVNDHVVTDPKYKVNFDDIIIYQNRRLNSQPFSYYLLNKPAGYICANKDDEHQCVVSLINRDDCYCLGRLDKDTTGLLILTNDPTLSKRLLLPQNHVTKQYLVTTKKILDKELVNIFNEGVIIDQKIKCLPAILTIVDEHHCYVTIEEGRYHQIKKMFLSCNNEVIALKRVAFGAIRLDPDLLLGQYRSLTNEEIELLVNGSA